MKKKQKDPESMLPLKPHWFYILLSLADRDRHGYGIMLEVLSQTSGKVRLWPATLYGTIKQLTDSNLIAESEERPDASEDDARRRYYRLTKFGRKVLTAESNRLETLASLARAKDLIQSRGTR